MEELKCRYCGAVVNKITKQCPSCGRDNEMFSGTMGDNAAEEKDLHKQSKHYSYGKKKNLDRIEKLDKINWENQDLDNDTYMALRTKKIYRESQAKERKKLYAICIFAAIIIGVFLLFGLKDSNFASTQVDMMSTDASCLYFSDSDGVYYYVVRSGDAPQLWHLSASTGKWSIKIDFETDENASLPVGPFYRISPQQIISRAPNYKNVNIDYFDLETTQEYIDYNKPPVWFE